MIHLLSGIVKRSFWQNWLQGLLVVPGPREIRTRNWSAPCSHGQRCHQFSQGGEPACRRECQTSGGCPATTEFTTVGSNYSVGCFTARERATHTPMMQKPEGSEREWIDLLRSRSVVRPKRQHRATAQRPAWPQSRSNAGMKPPAPHGGKV